MTNLSPAAQAILDAVKHYETNHWCHVNEVAAIILRAAADQVAPMNKELNETYLAGYYAEKNRQGAYCQAAGLRAVLAKWGKTPLLAIADELEAINFKRNKIKKQSKEVADYMKTLAEDEL